MFTAMVENAWADQDYRGPHARYIVVMAMLLAIEGNAYMHQSPSVEFTAAIDPRALKCAHVRERLYVCVHMQSATLTLRQGQLL
jgi:hypothetical protein